MNDKTQSLLAARVAEDRAVFEAIAEGLIVADHEGRVVLLNPAAQKMLGWSQEGAFGQPVDAVAPIKWQREQGDSVLSMTFAAVRQQSDYYLMTKGGESFLAAISASSIILEGRVVGTVMVFRDETTEQRALRSESDFIAIASHQLRTPLGSVKWNLEMLAKGEMGPLPLKALRAVQMTLDSNQKMISLVNDLLLVARITQHRVPDRPEMTDLAQSIEKAVAEMTPMALAKKVTVNFNKGTFLPLVYLDPLKFFEIVSNLLSNGVKYNVPGGRVTVSLEPSKMGVLLTVADTGIGISAADQKRLFKVFFRSEEAIKRDTDGTGLGLYVVGSYAKMWGGRAWCESAQGQGSKFFVEIPWKKK